MLRRAAFLALSSLALSGCVTYEVVERRVYHEDGSYTRIYAPDDGRRYEERRYHDDRLRNDGRVRRYEYDAPRYVGYGDHAPYTRWFYGHRGHPSSWYGPSRPHGPGAPRPRSMPKPGLRGVGPEVPQPVITGPSVGGEALRPLDREPREEPRFEPREEPREMPVVEERVE